MCKWFGRLQCVLHTFVFVLISVCCASAMTVHVFSEKTPVVQAEVVLWQVVADGTPKKLEAGKTDLQGRVTFSEHPSSPDRPLYLVSSAGKIENKNVGALTLLAILPSSSIQEVVVNELTTIGSIWPNAQQFDAKQGLSGSVNGVKIGSAQVPNLVDVSTGRFGKTVLNGENLTFSETVARMNTLAALVSLCGSNEKKGLCNEFLSVSGASDTLEALLLVARTPYQNTNVYFDLFAKAYPYPEGEGRRATSFLPYLSYVPNDFSLMVRFSGGGVYSPGRMMFDTNANLWSGQNWMPGSQSGLNTSIGGGVARLAPDGSSLSPDLVGYNGQGIDGIGWGTTVSLDKVWVAGFNKKIGVFDLNGKPLGPAKVNGSIGMLQGVATAQNGDVWVCDYQKDQLIRFPDGDHTKGEIVKVDGLRGPFAVVIDSKNIVWVTNAASDTVTRFPADDVKQAKQITVGVSPRGIAVDSMGNVWVAANLSPGYPLPKIPKGTGIMEEFRISIENLLANESKIPVTGNVTMLSSSGEVVKPNLLNGELYCGWGVSIDGVDNVFASNFMGTGFMHVCGAAEGVCPKGKKAGELIHAYQSGILQEVTDTMIDDAGNVWVANNWDVINALIQKDPDRRTATSGGGTGIAVVYGIAKPVKNPLIGVVRK